MQEITAESEEVCTIDPRVACLIDFKAWADGMTEQGHKLVVLTDANQLLEDTSESYNLRDLIGEYKLTRTMKMKHPGESLRSLDRGSKTIDHILTNGLDVSDIKQAGQLPFGLGFCMDHRGEFADLDGENILKIKMEEP